MSRASSTTNIYANQYTHPNPNDAAGFWPDCQLHCFWRADQPQLELLQPRRVSGDPKQHGCCARTASVDSASFVAAGQGLPDGLWIVQHRANGQAVPNRLKCRSSTTELEWSASSIEVTDVYVSDCSNHPFDY